MSLLAVLRKILAGEFEPAGCRLVYAQPAIHPEIRKLFRETAGFFFEVGANDGLTQSNTAYLERYQGWHGVLVEPLPMQFCKCLANRPASTVINAALVASDFSDRTVEIAYANLMSVVDDPSRNLLSIENHVATGRKFLMSDDLPLSGRRFIVPALTVSAILDRIGRNRVDFFSLDVEGYEFEVLKGIDFSRHRPRYFLIEARDKSGMDDFLAQQGYEYTAQWSEHDFLYADRS
jgi:FkbM family methyltransferase